MKGHIRQRGKKSWSVVIPLGRDPVTGQKKDKWHTVRGTKRDAQRECARLINALNEGTYQEPSKLTVAGYLEQWLDHVRPNVAAKTFERCQGDVAPAEGEDLAASHSRGHGDKDRHVKCASFDDLQEFCCLGLAQNSHF